MMNSRKELLVILAIVVSLVAVQGVWADELTGTVQDWTTEPQYFITLSVDGENQDIYGVAVGNLNKRKSLEIVVGTEMTVEYVTIGNDGNSKLFACSIIVDGKTYDLKHDDVCGLPE